MIPLIGASNIDLGEIARVIAHEHRLAKLDDDRQHRIPVADVEEVQAVAAQRPPLKGQEAQGELFRLIGQCTQATAGLAQCRRFCRNKPAVVGLSEVN